MSVFLASVVNTQFFLASGAPASGCKIFFYAAGSTTKQNTFTDNTGSVPWSNPIVLDAGGNIPNGGEVWFTSGLTYKAVYAPSNDTDPPTSAYWTKDNLAGINDVSAPSNSEWTSGPTPTYVSATQFTVVGNQTGTLHVGRRVKAVVTAGTVYGTIITSAYTTLTTITLAMDASSVLDSGLSSISYGLLASLNASVPGLIQYSLNPGPVNYAVASGTDTYTATLSPAPASVITGTDYNVVFTNANTLTTPTLNGTTIVKEGATALVPGDIPAGHSAILRKTATQFVLLNPVNGVVKLSRMQRAEAVGTGTCDCGTVNAGDRILFSFYITFSLASGVCRAEAAIAKTAGTATIQFGNGVSSFTVTNSADFSVQGANPSTLLATVIAKVTVSGTLTLGVSTVAAYGTAPTLGTAQAHAIVLNNG